MRFWHAELAFTGQLAERVTIAVENGRIASIEPESVPPAGAIRLPGITIPGLVNPHSHALHRALRGRTQRVASDFWAWRSLMYRLADRLDPDRYYRLARATYAEMALAGITAVGEFHYLHHDHGGRPYADANAMGEALIAAAAEAGIRLTLIDTCYLQAGLDGRPLEPAQRRFSDGDAEAWMSRADGLNAVPGAEVAAAIHSVRAVDPRSMTSIVAWSRRHAVPLHVHASEQPRENEECLAATGMTPIALLAEGGALGPETTVVHATHATPQDIDLLGSTGTTVCLCPTTERDLADGVGPAHELAAAGSPLTVASDMHAVIDMFEELRALELDQRLLSGRRGLHPPEQLLTAATTAGSASLGRDARGLTAGAPADFTTVALDTPRTAGATAATALDQLVFAAAAADVTDVVVAGRHVVEEGRHVGVGDVGLALVEAISEVMDEVQTADRAAARTT
ncbi:MAG TPA: formimidoylglutamate deiminase [Gaiellales bacterium]|nr:formimidoylglutamate deiminase [Gaiellales bacterium]